ncbi:MAG: PQQ-binding-like beta-propeller repeat protein [bacterium]|nr:PQQ-binding-like beta-propeller repeat protein [bacterium]
MIEGTVGIRKQDGALEGVGGVCVSNGREVVQTEADGSYRLPRQPEDRFVFVTVPAGYEAAVSFYVDLTQSESFDFELRENLESQASEFSFVQVTDIHMSLEGRSITADLVADLDQIHQEVGDQVRFIVATGDLTNRGKPEEFKAYTEAVATSRLPIYHCIGNHDDNDPDALGDHFMDVLGPTYYTFDYGPVHFVAYDGVRHSWPGPDHQADWLRADLDLHRGRAVVFLVHFPWGISFYQTFREDEIIASLSGHWHCTRVFQDGGTVHYNSPTLCFGGIDQSPRAYRLCTFRDGRLETEVRALDHTGAFSGISYRADAANRVGEVIRWDGETPEPGEDWPLFHGDAGRTGAIASGPVPPLTSAWKAGTGGGLHCGSPVMADGQVVIGTQDEDRPNSGSLVALDAREGALRWRYEAGGSIKLAPAFEDGRVFAVTVTGQVMALDAADGTGLWTYQLGDFSERWVYMAPLAWKGRLYVGMSSHFVALDQDTGTVVWMRDDLGKTDWIASFPSPAAWDAYVVIGFYGQPTNLVVVDAATGRTVWANDEDKSFRVTASPVVGADGTIYAVSGRTQVRAFEAETGRVEWDASLDQTRCMATPALAEDRLFVPSGDGVLHALDTASGQVLWTWEVGESLASYTPYVRGGHGALVSPVVVGQTVYVGAADGVLYALDIETGQAVWQHDFGVPTLSSPAVSGSGLWTGTCDGFVHAFSGA